MEIKDINNIEDIEKALNSQNYIANKNILYAVFTAIKLQAPLLVQGPPGTGKTEIAKVLSKAFDFDFLRIQCFEGIDFSKVLYEYDYAKQLLYLKTIETTVNESLSGLTPDQALKKVGEDIDFFGEQFLIRRPVLKAIDNSDKRPKVLLIDEIDKADEEFEAGFLEVLSEFSVSIPEYGTVSCEEDKKPLVVITANNSRELSEALKRRCIYLYIDYPSQETEADIIARKANVDKEFATKVANTVAKIRELDLKQKPSLSESMLWARALFINLGVNEFSDLNKEVIESNLGILLKNQTDINLVKKKNII